MNRAQSACRQNWRLHEKRACLPLSRNRQRNLIAAYRQILTTKHVQGFVGPVGQQNPAEHSSSMKLLPNQKVVLDLGRSWDMPRDTSGKTSRRLGEPQGASRDKQACSRCTGGSGARASVRRARRRRRSARCRLRRGSCRTAPRSVPARPCRDCAGGACCRAGYTCSGFRRAGTPCRRR